MPKLDICRCQQSPKAQTDITRCIMRYCFWEWSHIALDTKINQNDASVYTLKRSPKKKHLDLTISYKDGQTHKRNKEYLQPSSLCFPGVWLILQTLKASNSAIDNPPTLHFTHCKRDTLDAKAHRVRHVAGSLLTQPLHSTADWTCVLVSHLRGTSPCGFSPKMSHAAQSHDCLS